MPSPPPPRDRVGEFGLRGLDALPQARDLVLLRLRRQPQRRLRRDAGRVRIEARLVDREEAAERVEVALRDRIELVVVAARAADREPEERGAEGLDAVGDVLVPPFLVDAAAFVGLPVQPEERGGGARVLV